MFGSTEMAELCLIVLFSALTINPAGPSQRAMIFATEPNHCSKVGQESQNSIK